MKENSYFCYFFILNLNVDIVKHIFICSLYTILRTISQLAEVAPKQSLTELHSNRVPPPLQPSPSEGLVVLISLRD